MTGAYVRIARDDKWQSIEIDQLSDHEMDAFFSRPVSDKQTAEKWAKFALKWIRDNVQPDADCERDERKL